MILPVDLHAHPERVQREPLLFIGQIPQPLRHGAAPALQLVEALLRGLPARVAERDRLALLAQLLRL